MWANRKLSEKLGMGFGAVLILTVTTALFSWGGFLKVERGAQTGNAAGELLETVQQARLSEKDFIAYMNQKHVDDTIKKVDFLLTQARRSKEDSSDKQYQAQMDSVLENAAKYRRAFLDYVEFNRQSEEAALTMRHTGQITLTQTESIQAAQKAQLAEIREHSRAFLGDKLSKAQDADTLLKLMLEAKLLHTVLLREEDEEKLKEWTRRVEDIINLTEDLKGRFIQEQNIEQAESLLFRYQQYQTLFLEYILFRGSLNTQQMERLSALSEAEQKAMEKMEAVRSDLQFQIDTYLHDSEESIDDKLTKSENEAFQTSSLSKAGEANLLLKWAMEAKALRTALQEHVDENTLEQWKGLNKKIFDVSKSLKERFKDQRNIEQIDAVISYYGEYQDLFLKYVEESQHAAREEKEKLALLEQVSREAMQEMQIIRANQKADLDVRLSENEELMDDKLTKTEDAGQIIVLYSETRRNEKNFMIYKEIKYADEAERLLEETLSLAESTVLRFTDEKNTGKGRELIEALKAYQTALQSYRKLYTLAQAKEKEMLEAAQQVLNTVQTVRAVQWEKIQEKIRFTERWVGALTLLTVILGLFIAFYTTRGIVRPLKQALHLSTRLAAGDLAARVEAGDARDETGRLLHAMNEMAEDLQNMISAIQNSLAQLAEGRKEVLIEGEFIGDFVEIKNALRITAERLIEATDKNDVQNWLKTGQTRLNEQISGDKGLAELTDKVISFIVPYLEAQVGVVYLLRHQEEGEDTKEPVLYMSASYAHVWRKSIANQYKLGESLVGQAALEGKPIIISELPDSYLHIESGVGGAKAKAVMVLPFFYEDSLKGVIEVASLRDFTPLQLEFMEQALSTIAIAVNTAEARRKMKQLLEKTQAQAETLRQQQLHMQQTNEELQAQSEELQSQQEELRQTNEELEERTRELERRHREIEEKNSALEKAKQIVQAKAEELELAGKYKSEFLANMSHELRTPLNSLLILSQMLADNKEKTLSEKQIQYARTINNAGSDLLGLINDILDLSKVEAGKIEVHPEETTLGKVISSLQQKFQHIAEERGLYLKTRVSETLPGSLWVDQQRLHQILTNLLGNAFKFTHEGGVTLEIERPAADTDLSRSGLDAEKSIVFKVKDSGIGIPLDKQKVIFEAFQQADGTTNRKYGGTGLGLSISRQLTHLLGGEIHVRSEEEKGSCFMVYLPERAAGCDDAVSDGSVPDSPPLLLENPAAPEMESLQPPHEDDREHLQVGDKSILIIEDDPDFSRLLLELAREKDFKCLLAADGKSGLDLADKYLPGAIMLDLGLPLVDGWTVMEKLKTNPRTRHIPVHFLSGADHRLDARKIGAIGYSMKPVSMGELTETFKNIQDFMSKSVKKLLIISDNNKHQQAVKNLLRDIDVQAVVNKEPEQALEQLKSGAFDCVILDVAVAGDSGLKLLEQLPQEYNPRQAPIIVYAERSLNAAEQKLMEKCAANLTVKEVHSQARLLDEATLFLHQVESKLPEEQQKILRQTRSKEGVLEGKKVLLVDDDMRNVFALTAILEENGMEVNIATNGKEALELLDKKPEQDIVLMDIMMPEMDGYEAMRQIRARPEFRKLPIIALTAKAMKGDRGKCIEAGANDYMSKPVDQGRLLSLLRVWLYK